MDAMRSNVRRLTAVRRILSLERPDVAIGMMTTANCLLAVAGAMTGVPTVGSERTYPPAAPLPAPWKAIRRGTYRLLSAVVAQTQQTAGWLRSSAGARVTAVVPNPVAYPLTPHDSQALAPPSDGDGGLRRTLLSVGRLTAEKGFDRLISAFGDLATRFPEWRLAIAGDGPCRAPLEARIVSLGLQSRVHMPGVVGNIGDWYHAADLYVMTSAYEGFPNTLAEALAHGLPAVSLDCDTGPRDIVRHEVDGLLIDPADQSAFIHGLARLMEDEALRQRFSIRALECRDRFSMERIAGMWERLFADVRDNARHTRMPGMTHVRGRSPGT